MQLKEKELVLNKRAQDIGIVKFIVGTLLIGVVGLMLDFDTFFHEKIDDDRTFLVNQIELLREKHPSKRLSNIITLKGINGAPSQYLNDLEKEAIAEIKEKKAKKEVERKIALRKKAENEKATKEKIEKARQEEKVAIAAKVKAEKQARLLRLATIKARDKALQDAYPRMNLFELRRKGYQLP